LSSASLIYICFIETVLLFSSSIIEQPHNKYVTFIQIVDNFVQLLPFLI